MSRSEDLKLGRRNDPTGLVRRSLKNLMLIEHLFRTRKEGHVVTQLIQSLLAFLVIPKEKDLLEHLKRWRLEDLRENKWPRLTPVRDDEDDTHSLFDVLRHMRNAVCHGGIRFLGDGKDGADSRYPADVTIEFSDRNHKGQPVDWELRLTGEDLRKLLVLIEDIVFD
jgi:hypothetical protein